MTDSLYLECVTMPPSQSPFYDRDVYLVIKLGRFEIPVDPYCQVTASCTRHDSAHLYTFLPTDSDSQFSISIPSPRSPLASQDLDTFNHVLTQYLLSFSDQRDGQYHLDQKNTDPVPRPASSTSTNEQEYEDLRGHLILVNESDGTVLGDLDHDFKISEDPALSRDLPEDTPVVIELPPDYDAATADRRVNIPGGEFLPFTAREAFVRAVPPEERDAVTHTAMMIR